MTKFSMAPEVARRKISPRDAVTFDLEFPPKASDAAACRKWEMRAALGILSKRPPRLPGPVKVTLVYEQRPGRRLHEDLADPIIALCVKHNIIDSDHQNTLREMSAKFGHVSGVRVTIESAVTLERRSAA